MSKIKYFLRRLVRMDFGRMWQTACLLHKKTGRGTLWLLLDMLRCALRYNAGYVDYKIAEMYRLTPEQRATQITRGVSNAIVARMNDKAFWPAFDNKAEFNRRFARWVNRDYLDLTQATPDRLAAFLQGKEDFIVKPLDGSSGQGIFRQTVDPDQDPADLLKELRAAGGGIAEEVVLQHEALAALCPTSVNTVRVATLLGDKKQGIVYAYLRIGNGAVMDNVDQGGMAVPVDLETGVLCGVGADKQGNAYEFHPKTGRRIPGTQLPFWPQVTQMCLEAAQVVPQVRFVAWDVAFTPEGPTFIEGNSFPSHAIPQFAVHFPDGIGILPRFAQFIDLP